MTCHLRYATSFLVCFVLLAAGAAPRTSERFSFATYKERIGPVTILVGSFPAALHDGEEFIPLQIAVGLRGKNPRLTVTAESFTLIDQAGTAYPVASFREILGDDKLSLFATSITGVYPLVKGEQFANSIIVPSRFFPTASLRPRIERVHLARSTYFEDVVFFPRPDAGLGGVLTLRFHAEGMNDPIDVRFEVPLKGGRSLDS